jgi:hypothetical protein
MKTLYVTFHTRAVCIKEIEVPDDYQIEEKNPYKFWKDLYGKYQNEIGTDIMSDAYDNLWGVDLGDFYIDLMGLECIELADLKDEGGNQLQEMYFDDIPFSEWRD